MIDITKPPYNADNTGILSCYNAFLQALTDSITLGNEIYFPPGTYRIKGSSTNVQPVCISGAGSIKPYGKGAVIVCDTDIDAPNINGSGGGFAFTADNITLEDLRFIGYTATSPTDPNHTLGRLVQLTGNYCTVRNCYFKEGNGGAVQLLGNYNFIQGNVFENCNNYNGSGDYGAIQINSPSLYVTISENRMIGQFHSGISAYGPGTNGGIAYLDILNNYIRSNSSSLITVNHSMGIYFINGANEKIKIIGNTIEKIDAEGIIITSAAAYPASKCIIANNIIRDCDYEGISLHSADEGGTYTDFEISGNIIENSGNALNYAHQIYLDRVSDSNIYNNKCIGVKNGANYLGVGIAIDNYSPRNRISDNQMRTLNVGISYQSRDGQLTGNHVYDCNQGLYLGFCQGTTITCNLVNRCITGVYYFYTVPYPLHILGNAITQCTNRYGTLPGVDMTPEVLTHSGTADDATNSFSYFIATGTLAAGVANVTFYNVFPGDRFLVVPNNESGDVQGVLYVSQTEPAFNIVTVRSTLVTDNRSFTLVKFISGG